MMKLDKSELRLQFLKKRRAFVESQVKAQQVTTPMRGLSGRSICLKDKPVSHLARQLGQQIQKFQAASQASGAWAAYYALPDEADPILTLLHSKTIEWTLPKVVGEGLRFFKVSPQTPLQENKWDIPEPDTNHGAEVNIEGLNGVLVPGVAFDIFGGRIGMGKGFYDKVLQNFKGLKVGLAYSVQISAERLPLSPHDIQMDYLITEQKWMSCSAA